MKNIIYSILACLALFAQALKAQDPVFSLPAGLQVTAGETFEVKMSVDSDLTPHNVLAYSFAFSYNASLLEIKDLQYDPKLQNFSNVNNTLQAGKLTLTGASSSKAEGSGTLVTITFEAKAGGTAPLNFITGECILNEGLPNASYLNGSISIANKPLITLTPNTAFLARGQTLQCNVSGNGTAPYSWGVTNPEVASVSASGLITALGHGTTKVFVEDAAGLRDESDGLIKVTALSLSLPVDLQEWQGWELDIPVNANGFDLLNVVSGQLTLTYRTDVLQFVGAETSGTILENSSLSVGEVQGGQLNLAFASTSPLTESSGSLVVLRFKVLPGATASTTLNFSNVLFNEAIEAFTINGSFSPRILPILSISPPAATMVAGDTLIFTASNGHEPYTWSTSDERVARVNEDGRLIAYEGGVTDLTVSDAVGAITSLKNIKVSDMLVYFPSDTLEKINSLTLTPCRINAVPLARPAVSSIEGEISVANTNIKLLDIFTEGSLTEGWQKIITRISEQRIKFYLAGATPFSRQGAAFYVSMELMEGFKEYDRSDILFHNLLINEGTPIPMLINGSLEGKLFTNRDKTIHLGESTGELFVSESEEGTISKWQKRKRIPGQIMQWIDLNFTSRQISDIPDAIGEWEYNVLIDGASVKVANITVIPVPDSPVSLRAEPKNQDSGSFCKEIRLYPNPTKGSLELDLKQEYQQIVITIINISGQSIAEHHFNHQSVVRFELSGPAGVYFMAINAENRKTVIKVIKNQ